MVFVKSIAHHTHLLARRLEQQLDWFARGGLDLLFPPACLLCEASLDFPEFDHESVPFCDACRSDLVSPVGPACTGCGIGFAWDEDQDPSTPCLRCNKRSLAFGQVVRLNSYEGKIREVVLRMKNPAGQNLAMGIGSLLWSQWGDELLGGAPELVISVPSHWRKQAIRGADSSKRMADVLAKNLRVPHVERLLVRDRNTLPQFDLSPEQRFKNVRGAFSLSKAYTLSAKRALLVDDILTTGATCHEAARALRRAGVEEITVAVGARALGV